MTSRTRERFIEILGLAPPHDQAKIVSGVWERFPLDAENAPRTRTAELRGKLEGIVGRLRAGGGVARPSPRVSSEAVARALSDADTLVGTTDAGNAVDRLLWEVLGRSPDQLDAVASLGDRAPRTSLPGDPTRMHALQ